MCEASYAAKSYHATCEYSDKHLEGNADDDENNASKINTLCILTVAIGICIVFVSILSRETRRGASCAYGVWMLTNDASFRRSLSSFGDDKLLTLSCALFILRPECEMVHHDRCRNGDV